MEPHVLPKFAMFARLMLRLGLGLAGCAVLTTTALAQDDEAPAPPTDDASAPPASMPAADPAPATATPTTTSTTTGDTPPPPTAHGRLGAAAEREYLEGKNTPPPEDYDLSRFPDYGERHGFTLELGFGLGFSHVANDFNSELNIGFSQLSLSLGGFITPHVALMARMAGTSWFEEDFLGDSVLVSSSFYGGAAQFWLSDAAFLGAGIGIGVLDESIFSEDVIEADTGVILTGRAGWAFYTNQYHAFALVGEVFPAFYGDVTVVAFAIDLQWQLL